MSNSSEHDEELQLTAELEAVMTSCLDPMPPSAALLARLQRTIAQPPQRYAPFYRRLGELFDLPEPEVVTQLARLAQPEIWQFSGLPGVRNVMVEAGPGTAGAETVFARFAPGLRFPRHRHTGVETVLVLEGEYADSEGVVHRPGELRAWVPGTNHGFHVSKHGPCIIASVVHGREFEAAPLRWLARILGR
jgi:putative transcriptional regulator